MEPKKCPVLSPNAGVRSGPRWPSSDAEVEVGHSTAGDPTDLSHLRRIGSLEDGIVARLTGGQGPRASSVLSRLRNDGREPLDRVVSRCRRTSSSASSVPEETPGPERLQPFRQTWTLDDSIEDVAVEHYADLLLHPIPPLGPREFPISEAARHVVFDRAGRLAKDRIDSVEVDLAKARLEWAKLGSSCGGGDVASIVRSFTSRAGGRFKVQMQAQAVGISAPAAAPWARLGASLYPRRQIWTCQMRWSSYRMRPTP